MATPSHLPLLLLYRSKSLRVQTDRSGKKRAPRMNYEQMFHRLYCKCKENLNKSNKYITNIHLWRIYSLIFVEQMDEALGLLFFKSEKHTVGRSIWKQRFVSNHLSSQRTHSCRVFYVLLQGQMGDWRPCECTLPLLKAWLNFYTIKKRQ